MKTRRLVLLILVMLLLVGGALTLQRVYAFLLTNKAIYLTLRGHHHEAEALLDYVVSSYPTDKRARRALAMVELNLGNYGLAELLLSGLERDAERLVGEALCYFQMDREVRAAEVLREAELRPGDLSPELEFLVKYGPDALRGGDVPNMFLDVRPSHLPRAHKMFLLSLQGRAAWQKGKLVTALDRLRRALEQEDRNARSRRLAIILAAVMKDFSRAHFYADTAGTRRIDWEALDQELAEAEERFSTSTIALPVSDQKERWRVALQGARVWSLITRATDSRATCPLQTAYELSRTLLQEAPRDVSYLLLAARAAEAAEKPAEAYQLLAEWSRQRKTYAVRLRMADLAGEELEDVIEEFAQLPQVVASFGIGDMQSTGGVVRRDVLAFYESGRCGMRVEVPEAGRYFAVLTARGDRAFGLSPLVNLHVDGLKREEIYVAHEGWDSYAVKLYLTRGVHNIELEYANNSERLPSKEEDRNFYVINLMITRDEGSDDGSDAQHN